MEVIRRDKVEYYRREKGGSGKGCANRRVSIICRTPLSSSCGKISDEWNRDMAGLNKHRNQAAVTHACGLVLTWDISHRPLSRGFIFFQKKSAQCYSSDKSLFGVLNSVRH